MGEAETEMKSMSDARGENRWKEESGIAYTTKCTK